MNAHVLLNLLNVLGKRLNARLAEHFISFATSLMGTNLRARMLDSIYHMAFKGHRRSRSAQLRVPADLGLTGLFW